MIWTLVREQSMRMPCMMHSLMPIFIRRARPELKWTCLQGVCVEFLWHGCKPGYLHESDSRTTTC